MTALIRGRRAAVVGAEDAASSPPSASRGSMRPASASCAQVSGAGSPVLFNEPSVLGLVGAADRGGVALERLAAK